MPLRYLRWSVGNLGEMYTHQEALERFKDDMRNRYPMTQSGSPTSLDSKVGEKALTGTALPSVASPEATCVKAHQILETDTVVTLPEIYY